MRTVEYDRRRIDGQGSVSQLREGSRIAPDDDGGSTLLMGLSQYFPGLRHDVRPDRGLIDLAGLHPEP